MKKIIALALCLTLAISLAGCGAKKYAAKWDCSVSCAGESSADAYVITYSEQKVVSKTGTLTIQNCNDFEIEVHLLSTGAQELVSESIPAGGCFSFLKVTASEYTVGIHADVAENTEIKVFVYDGNSTEPTIPENPIDHTHAASDEAVVDNADYYNLSEQEPLQVTGEINADSSFIKSQRIWTNSTKIELKNNSGVEVVAELFANQDDSTPIMEMTLKRKEKKNFTGLTSQEIYSIRFSTDSSATLSVEISD